MNGIACAYHPDRLALGYCAGCGRPLCAGCVVRLTFGNYCAACAEAPSHRPQSERQGRPRLWLWAGLAVIAMAAYVLSRLL